MSARLIEFKTNGFIKHLQVEDRKSYIISTSLHCNPPDVYNAYFTNYNFNGIEFNLICGPLINADKRRIRMTTLEVVRTRSEEFFQYWLKWTRMKAGKIE